MHPFLALHAENRRNTTIPDPGFIVDKTPDFTRFTGPGTEVHENGVVYTRLRDEAHAEKVIRDQIAHFAGRAFEWKFCDYDTPADLAGLLVKHGFEPQEPETVMAFSLGGTFRRDVRSAVSVRRLRDESDWRGIADLQRAVHGESWDWLIASLKEELSRRPGSLEVYVAETDGRVVSAGWIRFEGKFASLWGGSTLPEYRGRGAYSALVDVRRKAAEKRGLAFLTIEASPRSEPIVEKLGFARVCRTIPYFHGK